MGIKLRTIRGVFTISSSELVELQFEFFDAEHLRNGDED